MALAGFAAEVALDFGRAGVDVAEVVVFVSFAVTTELDVGFVAGVCGLPTVAVGNIDLVAWATAGASVVPLLRLTAVSGAA